MPGSSAHSVQQQVLIAVRSRAFRPRCPPRLRRQWLPLACPSRVVTLAVAGWCRHRPALQTRTGPQIRGRPPATAASSSRSVSSRCSPLPARGRRAPRPTRCGSASRDPAGRRPLRPSPVPVPPGTSRIRIPARWAWSRCVHHRTLLVCPYPTVPVPLHSRFLRVRVEPRRRLPQARHPTPLPAPRPCSRGLRLSREARPVSLPTHQHDADAPCCDWIGQPLRPRYLCLAQGNTRLSEDVLAHGVSVGSVR